MGTKKITGALEVSGGLSVNGNLSVSGSSVSFNNQNLSFNVANLDASGSLTTRTAANRNATITLNKAIVGVSGSGVGEKSDFVVSNQNILSKNYNTIESNETWTEIALSSIPAAYLALIRRFIPNLSTDNLTKCEMATHGGSLADNTNPLIDETNNSIAQQIGKYYETDSDDYDWTYTIYTNGNLYYLHAINVDANMLFRLTYNYTVIAANSETGVTASKIYSFRFNNIDIRTTDEDEEVIRNLQLYCTQEKWEEAQELFAAMTAASGGSPIELTTSNFGTLIQNMSYTVQSSVFGYLLADSISNKNLPRPYIEEVYSQGRGRNVKFLTSFWIASVSDLQNKEIVINGLWKGLAGDNSDDNFPQSDSTRSSVPYFTASSTITVEEIAGPAIGSSSRTTQNIYAFSLKTSTDGNPISTNNFVEMVAKISEDAFNNKFLPELNTLGAQAATIAGTTWTNINNADEFVALEQQVHSSSNSFGTGLMTLLVKHSFKDKQPAWAYLNDWAGGDGFLFLTPSTFGATNVYSVTTQHGDKPYKLWFDNANSSPSSYQLYFGTNAISSFTYTIETTSTSSSSNSSSSSSANIDVEELYIENIIIKDNNDTEIIRIQRTMLLKTTEWFYGGLNSEIQDVASDLNLTISTITNSSQVESALTTILQALQQAGYSSQIPLMLAKWLDDSPAFIQKIFVSQGTSSYRVYTSDDSILYLKGNGTFGNVLNDFDTTGAYSVSFNLYKDNLTD